MRREKSKSLLGFQLVDSFVAASRAKKRLLSCFRKLLSLFDFSIRVVLLGFIICVRGSFFVSLLVSFWVILRFEVDIVYLFYFISV